MFVVAQRSTELISTLEVDKYVYIYIYIFCWRTSRGALVVDGSRDDNNHNDNIDDDVCALITLVARR